MYKLAHISDTHIKLLKQHKEYKKIFEEMYSILRKETPDIIVHCGDLFHNKTALSPEGVQIGIDFLRNLADIAPTYIIAGNHDLTLNNASRLDAISPIVNSLCHPNLHYLKNSGEVQIGDEIVLNPLVITDEPANWAPISDWKKINIALYHGSISGVVTDQGYTLERGDHPLDIFKGFDYAFLGDIHKTHQKLDEEGRIAYPGSTIQQNHGETNDKGFLIWEIENKDDFEVRHISIPNPTPFITIELDADGSIPENSIIPENSKLRLVSNTHISPQALKKSVDIAKKSFKPESITVHNRPGKRISVDEISRTLEEDNLRDIKIQESLILEYIKDYKLNQNIENKILDLNKKYNLLAEQTEEVARNVNWKLKNIEWENLFNYGGGNSINFDSINGVLGIFGKNYTGKSSSIDSILWGMFNSISKKSRKNVDIINQNKNNCKTTVTLEIDNKSYVIEREATKYVKKLYGEETTEAKTTLNFSSIDLITNEKEILNAEDRNGTDANIRKVFGTIDDFLLTSMTSQMGSMSFIDEGSTKRKEIFGKFLDLEMFEKKYKLAKEDSALLKGAIKRLEGRDYEQEIKDSIIQSIQTSSKIESNKNLCQTFKTKQSEMNKVIAESNLKISSGPKMEIINIEQVEKEIANIQESLKECVRGEIGFVKSLKDMQNIISETEVLVSNFNITKLKEDSIAYEDSFKKLNSFLTKMEILSKDKEIKKQKIAILDTVPCGDSFPKCRFLMDANSQKALLPELEIDFSKSEEQARLLTVKVADLKKSIKEIQVHQVMKDKLSELQTKLADIELRKEKNKNLFKNFETSQSLLENKRKTYFENEDWMKERKLLEKQKTLAEASLAQISDEFEDCENKTMSLYQLQASYEQKKISLEQQKQELSDLRDEYLAFDLFLKCMHSNGIVYDIIKKKLPVINQEIAKNLTNIVDFEIFFEDDGKKLDIFIKHPKYDSRPIELCSGAEKTIASMAIRLALIKVSSLPVGDIFILDEPATSLDEDNMEGFTRIIEMIKTQFKIVILISHLESLKDIVDDQIIIEKSDGYAKIVI